MHRPLVCFLIIVFSFQALVAQEKITLFGTITEASSNETLIGVSIAVPELQTGVITNEYGFYSLTLPKGKHTLIISYIGFKEVKKEVDLTKDTTLNLQLNEDIQELNEVILTEDIEKVNIRKPQMSVNSLSSSSIKKIPAILGEADVLKSILLLPGVTSAGEGASGFNVRGGSVDQNLILLDEATIFNSSHLFGFFSVFNPDAIKDLKLYKGGIPAKYGGRISSVLDIYQKEGNSKEFKANGGIGIVSSRLLLEGPLKKDKGAFLIGGRSSYAHLFLPLFDNDNKAYFYDLNTKLNYKINKNNNLYASGYFGRDVFSISNSFVNTYGNSVINLRWNHLYSEKLFSNLSLIYSDYFYGLELDFVGFKWNSGIQNFNLKYDFKHYLSNNLKLNYGINNTYYRFNPGEIKPNRSDSGILPKKLIDKYANEFAAYIDAEHKITNNLTLQYGLRWSNFTRLGQDELFIYENDQAVNFNSDFQIYESAEPIGKERFKKSAQITTFNNLEPRLALSYALNNNNSIKASYNHMVQYLHLLSNTSSPTPLDVWTPSGKYIKPQILDQYAVGYFKNFKSGDYSIETEAYYKDVQNRIDYIDGANLIANDAIEQVILNGKMRSYGLEFMFKKNSGKLNGWLSYTLAKSEQKTPGRTAAETGINNGNWYATSFDKTHDLSINTSYNLNEKWSFNSNLIYQTGQPTNYPVGKFEFQDLSIPIYGDRNDQRLPSYHRLDISATLTPRKNKNRKLQAQWIFGIYNVYNRKNAASISFSRNEDSGNNEALRTSIFGLVPSVTYNFKF
ncbi:TonB-dependent receptor [Cellulophaga fucicola]|uniref:Outer membrane receptor proteins, mostly Fe transport n=1 Tax=Cellulophaga fucicola TaxID=76595 RepID=A0A1K1MW26_9FLAO|nr:TonB-dependent receptor [Cellulophaga fucicola]SFW27378.1 Outer membrane receptor proteins, mostly Fe transport [Cellulophaga fucicola]